MAVLNVEKPIAVIGAGTMGAGIAQVAANAGHEVVLLDVAEGAAQKGIDGIRAGLQKLVSRGKKNQVDVDELLSRITPTESLSDINGSCLVVEAIIENLDIKQSVIADVEQCVDQGTIIASNTSSISISALAAKSQRPENIVGMHFFNPAAILKLVEVVSGLQTSDTVAQTVYDTAMAWGKKPVHAKSTPGFIVNRVARPYYAEALRSVTEQFASVETIDVLMRECGGFKMGPLELTDLIGQDVNCAVTESVYNAFYQDKRFMPSVLQAEMVSAGLLGRKSGQGFYAYHQGKKEADVDDFQSVSKLENVQTLGNIDIAVGMHNCMAEQGYTGFLNFETEGCIEAGDATIKFTDGRTATCRATQDKIKNLILVDYARDYRLTQCVGLTASCTATDRAIEDARQFFQSIGKRVLMVKDIPGMQVLRTVCMLVNEAYDTVNQGVCSFAAVDLAMKAGVAYPLGPIAWGDLIGVKRVSLVLQNIEDAYGEDRYRVSPLLLEKAYEF